MSGACLHAEEELNSAIGGGLTFATDSLKKVTHTVTGFNFNISTQMPIASSNVMFRPGLGLSILPGKWGENNDLDNGITTQSKTQLINVQGSLDILIPAGSIQGLSVVSGISLNQWRYQGQTQDGNPHPFGLDGSKASATVKVGARLGFDYRWSKAWSGEMLLQIVEFGSNDDQVHMHNINPAWVQVGVKYHF
jgi:hypothetical protein